MATPNRNAQYLFKRPDSPYWWLHIQLPGMKKPERKSCRTTQKRDATRVLVDRTAELEDELSGHGAITLGAAVERTKGTKRREANWPTYEGRCRKLCAPGGIHPPGTYEGLYALDADTELHRLQDRHVEDYVAARLDEGMAASSINNELKVLACAVKASRGYKMPDLRIRYLKTKRRVRYLLPGEEESLLAELEPGRAMRYQPAADQRAPHIAMQLQDQYDFVLLLLDTGIRHTEGSTLTWEAIDTQDWQYISIYRTKTQNAAMLPLSGRLAEALRRRYSVAREHGGLPYVFPGYNGAQRVSRPRGHATRGICRAIERAGLNQSHLTDRYGRFTVHSLRHSFAAKMVQNGMSLHELRDVLGHTSVKTTEIYGHLMPTQGTDRMRMILSAA